MNDLRSPGLAQLLSQLAHLLGDLWELRGQLSIATTTGRGAVAFVDAARAAAEALAPLHQRLAELATGLPAAAADLADNLIDTDSALQPLELTRAGLECVLADHLSPALTALAQTADITLDGSPSTSGATATRARAALQCVLVDRLDPAIAALAAALHGPGETAGA